MLARNEGNVDRLCEIKLLFVGLARNIGRVWYYEDSCFQHKKGKVFLEGMSEDKAVQAPREPAMPPLVSVIMGSTSDWETMRHAGEILTEFGVPHECLVVSAHRTPAWMAEFAAAAEGRGIEVIIAGAGGAAHLPGMVAAQTLVPVLGVPVQSRALKGMDSLLSIVQMPGGIPVGTLAIGEAGAKNAALLAIAILGNSRPELRDRLRQFRSEQELKVREARLT